MSAEQDQLDVQRFWVYSVPLISVLFVYELNLTGLGQCVKEIFEKGLGLVSIKKSF